MKLLGYLSPMKPVLLAAIACSGICAQSTAPRNEEFDLNISEERITEADFRERRQAR